MIYRISQILLLSVILVGCSTGFSPIKNAGENYEQNRNHKSLETIANGLYKGMRRSEVERLLGVPDYSPIEGQYYYSSDRFVGSDDKDRGVAVGLVVDYRDENGEVTDTLHDFRLGPIGE